jgi:hypothetical protein
MALTIGDKDASTGMTKAIYDELRAILEQDLQSLDEDKLALIREGWKTMAYAVAKGVVEHIKASMEIAGIQTQGIINSANVVFSQSNDGTGHVK